MTVIVTVYACITGVDMTIIIVMHKLINKFNIMNASIQIQTLKVILPERYVVSIVFYIDFKLFIHCQRPVSFISMLN